MCRLGFHLSFLLLLYCIYVCCSTDTINFSVDWNCNLRTPDPEETLVSRSEFHQKGV